MCAKSKSRHYWKRKLMKIGLEDGAKAAILTTFDL
jgi:hypothetical protein